MNRVEQRMKICEREFSRLADRCEVNLRELEALKKPRVDHLDAIEKFREVARTCRTYARRVGERKQLEFVETEAVS